MKKIVFTVNFLLIFVSQSLHAEDLLTRDKVLEYSAVSFLPKFIAGNVFSWISESKPPNILRYGVPPLSASGFFLLKEPKKALLYGGVDAVAMTTAYLLKDNSNCFQLLRTTGGKFADLTQYEVYKSARQKANINEYRVKWQEVEFKDAILAPLRFDYLKDPDVSLFIAAEMLGTFLYFRLSENYSKPSEWWESLHILTKFYSSYMAGVGEEAQFRGFLLPEMVESFGKTPGYILNSFLFAGVHYDASMKGEELKTFLTEMLIGGIPKAIYLSYLSYDNNFDFRKAAFCHTWISFLGEIVYYHHSKDKLSNDKSLLQQDEKKIVFLIPSSKGITLFSYKMHF